MPKALQSIFNNPPRRRRRFWRYVSPRRHGAGAVALALLTLLVYAYWNQTNDRQVRRKAEQYLQQLTGARVKVHKGHFSLFKGIQLEGVRLYVPGAREPEPFFHAAKVTMRHNPWHLLVNGRIEPDEIVCSQPVVNLVYDAELGAYSARKLLHLARERNKLNGLAAASKLPRIRIRQGRLRVIDVDGDNRQRVGEVPIEISMSPKDGRYEITFEETGNSGAETMRGKVAIDLASGAVVEITGTLPLASIEKALPRKYRIWRSRYALAGSIELKEFIEVDGRNTLTAELRDVSMRLPKDEGDLALSAVRGTLIFRNSGVELRAITGRIAQAGNAQFTLSGSYSGYETTSPFSVTMKVLDMKLPASESTTGDLAKALATIRETYQFDGPMDLTVTFMRDSAGKVSYEGLGEPKGLSMVYKHFPYRIENVRGKIAFRPGVVELSGITAKRGQASCRIDGRVDLLPGGMLYDVTVKASNIRLDEELQRAIPEAFQPVWRALDPRGRTTINAHVFRRKEDKRQQVELHLAMDGKGSIQYSGFPYRIEKLVGDAYIAGRGARIDNVTATRGPASCTINGRLDHIGTDRQEIDLKIEGANLPLDEKLAEAVGAKGQKALGLVRPEGSVEKFTARVWQSPGQKLDYNIVAKFRDVTVTPENFPYEVTNAAGVLTIRPNHVVIERIEGTHGPASIAAGGQVYLGDEQFGLDLHVSCKDLALDEDLRAALPRGFQDIWRQLSPEGLVDISLDLQQNTPDNLGNTDYRLTLQAKDMTVTCGWFPYPLRGISGQITAVPGKVVLEELACQSGQMRGSLTGTFLSDDDGLRAELTVSATDVPIDESLLSAIPGDFGLLAGRFSPGGTCDVDLRKLSFFKPKAVPTTNPASQPAHGGPSTLWSVTGNAVLNDAQVNIGLGAKTLTGRIEGTGYRNGQGVGLDATIDLEKAVAGKHQVTDLTGTVTKSPTSPILKFEDVSAKSHGGRLAGFALVELADPLRYKASLLLDGVSIEKLLAAAGVAGDDKPTGLLTGRIELAETVGRADSRQASGVFRVYEGKLYRKLPILLDLLTVVYLSVPGNAAFTEGEFTYHLRGDSLVFREIYLRGPTLSLVGSGSMSMKTKAIKLYFLIDPLGELPRLSGLADELLTGILRQLSEVEVTGTLAHPKTRTRTLGSLEDAIRKLMAPNSRP